MKKEITLEQALEKLEKITEIMQSGDISVDEALKLFEEGTQLVALCREKLDKAEFKISELSGKTGGCEDE